MRYAALLLTATALAACGEGANESASGRAEEVLYVPTTDAAAPAPALERQSPAAPRANATSVLAGAREGAPVSAAATVVPSMLIRTGEAHVEVDEIDPAVAAVRTLAQRLGGYVGNTSQTGGRQQVRRATLELKIPAQRFEEALSGLKPVGRVQSVSSTAQDVGEEYVDLEARRANASRLEQRLVELLATRTGRLEDVLTVERELARVREEIERYDGRLRFLRTRAAVSTLTVQLREPAPLLDSGPGANPIVRAVRRAWVNLVSFIAGFIEMLGFLIPLGALLAAAWWAVRRLRGRSRRTPPA